METGQWLQPKEMLPDMEQVASVYVKGSQWQLYTTLSGGYALAVSGQLYDKWLQKNLVEDGLMLPAAQGRYILTAPAGEKISSLEYGPFPGNSLEVKAFARALKTSIERAGVSLADGLYIPRFGSVLPTYCDTGKTDPEWILGAWICAGMRISLADTERIHKYAPWLSDPVRVSLLEMFGIEERSDGDSTILQMPSSIDPAWEKNRAGQLREGSSAHARAGRLERKERKEGPFSLPGRPALEKFFREEILDVIDREEEYRRFGVGFPGATLLYGPSGSGKTFAVEKLADYLGWPVLRINSATVGSKYVHETSRKVSEIFDMAIREAPSILIIDEMEAFLSSRESARGSVEIHLEEVGEFLRRIPDAAENHVLLFGMTNMKDAIDQAILRKGRFDHILEVGMPSASEVQDVLESILKDLPTEGDLKLSRIADRLAQRPLSDVSFVVSEAGRLCVQKRIKAIDAGILEEACDKLAPGAKEKRRIGFFS